MAGRPKTRLKKDPEYRAQRRLKKRVAKNEAINDVHTALLRATEDGGLELTLAPNTSTAELLAWALRRVHAVMMWAGQQGDAVPADKFWVNYYDAQGNVRTEPNKWFQLERAMREEAVKLAARMQELGLAERAVALEEAKAIMVAQAVRGAAEAAGIPEEQIQRLGEELRKGLESGAIQEPVAA